MLNDNISKALRQFGGQSLVTDLVNFLIEDYFCLLQEITQASDDQNWQKLKSLTGDLQYRSNAIGATFLSQNCENLVLALESQNSLEVRNILAQLTKDYNLIANVLRSYQLDFDE